MNMKDLVYEITFVGFDKQQVEEAAAALGLEKKVWGKGLLTAVTGGKRGYKTPDPKFYRAVSYEKLKPHQLGRDGIESDIYVLNNDESNGSRTAPNLQDAGTNIQHNDGSTVILAYFAATGQLVERQRNSAFKPIEGRKGTLAEVLDNYQELIPGDRQANRVPGERTINPV